MACSAEFPGTTFAVPPNGYRNQLVAAAKPPGVTDVWLNYQDRAGVWKVNAPAA